MVVTVWGFLQLCLSALVLSSLVIWGLVAIGTRRDRKRLPSLPAPITQRIVFQPLAEDYLSDILDSLREIEGSLGEVVARMDNDR